MAKFHLPKLNSWVTPLVLASIGLHGLVLALPMPDLAETPPEVAELSDPEVIQVVTLPKLATAPGSTEPSIPEPPPPPPEKPVEDVIITDLEVLEEVELEEPDESSLDDNPLNEPDPANNENSGDPADTENTPNTADETELDKRLKDRSNYGNFNTEKTGADYREGGSYFNGALTGWMGQKAVSNPQIFQTDRLGAIEAQLPPVKALKCLPDSPSKFVSVAVEVSPVDGGLVGSPALLNSTGYEILDQKALEVASEADYSPYYDGDNPAPGYWFNVTVAYESC